MMELHSINPGETKEMVFVRLAPDSIAELDRVRGRIPRSTLIRMIIERVLQEGVTLNDEEEARPKLRVSPTRRTLHRRVLARS